tara:strand:+ start:19442 stop:20617 length:1176 start_codon:yes stop_codon:yes gene_type:complete
MFNKNFIILCIGQTFSYTSPVVNILLSGIIGSRLINFAILSTLPTALMVVGTAIGSLFASKVMSLKGRKFGFCISALFSSIASLLCAYSIFLNNFIFFCFANFLVGLCFAFIQLYRFAATEVVSKGNIPRAVSIILLLSIVATILGSNIVSISKNYFYTTYVGSYIFLSMLNIVPFFFFLFYKNTKLYENRSTSFYNFKKIFLLLSNKFILLSISSASIGFIVMSLIMTATPICMHIFKKFTLIETSLVIQLHSIGMFLPSLVTGELIKKFGHLIIIYCGILIMFVCITINFYFQSYYGFMFGLILLGVGWNFLFVSGTSLLVISYHKKDRYIAQGLNDFIVFTTQAIGALSAGILLYLLGWKILNLICIPILILLLFYTFMISKNFQTLK